MSPKTRQSAEMSLARRSQSRNSYVSLAATTNEGSTVSEENRQSGEMPLARRLLSPLRVSHQRERSRRNFASAARLSSKATRKPTPISVLPDGLLVAIFKMLYTPDTEGFAFSVRIAQVSRRFRAVAFSTSRLWSTVSPTQRPEELKSFLERSGAARLTILIPSGCRRLFDEGDIRRFIVALRPYYPLKWETDKEHIVFERHSPCNQLCGLFADLGKLKWIVILKQIIGINKIENLIPGFLPLCT